MQVVCNQTVKDPNNSDNDVTIRTRALECLVKIAMLYYEVNCSFAIRFSTKLFSIFKTTCRISLKLRFLQWISVNQSKLSFRYEIKVFGV